MRQASRDPTRWLLAILIGLLATPLSFAFTANAIRLGATSNLRFETSSNKAIKAMGIRFELDRGLRIVLTNKGRGRIGDVVVPAYDVHALPKNALGDYEIQTAITRTGVVQAYPGGFLFVLKETHTQKAMTRLMRHLAAIGARIGALEASGRAFGFTAAGAAYRAVFSADPSGTLVYLGN